MAVPQQASLLGIPEELRLHIYDEVLDLDIHNEVVSGWTGGLGPQGFWSSPIRNETTKLNVPWLNLMLTCATFAQELRYHMTHKPNRTCTADIMRRGSGLGSFVWRKLGCDPFHVDTLAVNYHPGEAQRMDQFWGDGGPLPIVRELFQTLNVLLHCGPRLDVTRPLQRPMHIRNLVIEHCFPDKGREEGEELKKGRVRGREHVFNEVNGFAATVCRQGIVYGLIDEFEVDYGDGPRTFKVEVPDNGTWVMPGYWHRYGFEWGLEQFGRSASQAQQS